MVTSPKLSHTRDPPRSSGDERCGAPRTTCRSGRSTCSTTRCCASRCGRARQAAAARPLGHDAGPQLHLRPHEPRDPPRDLNTIYITGPGHGGPGAGRERLSRGHLQRGLPAHRPATRRGCGGCSVSSRSRAGYRATSRPRRPARSTRAASSATRSLHAYGAVFDNPDLLAAASSATARPRRVRSRPAGTRTSSSTRSRDGAVLPMLHLNGYKIANPTVLARIPDDELRRAARGLRLCAAVRRGRRPGGDAPADGGDARRGRRGDHGDPAAARARDDAARPRWPMIVLRTPKGWTGPKDRRRAAGRGHLGARIRCRWPRCAPTPSTCAQLEEWLRSYRPEELFDEAGALRAELAALRPKGDRRMSANPHANGGLLLRDARAARLPRLRRRRSPPGARPSARRRACSARSCAT